MGACFSKCKPKKKFKEDCSHVQDKLVISQDPPISSLPTNMTTMPLEKPLSPAPSTSSTASFSSFSCSTNRKYSTMASSVSSSSSSSCSSSILSVKDRSFSNEFLWSCVKDNPHIVGLNEKSQEKTVLSNNYKIHSPNLDPSSFVASPIVTKLKPSMQEKVLITVSTPKKRARASSPTLVRQKSFRKEQISVGSMPNRGLRSPSPSRRFNGENTRSFQPNGTTYENSCRRPVLSKGNAVSSATFGPKRESFRPPAASPNSDLKNSRNISVTKTDTISQQISTKIDGHVDVGEVKSSQEMDIVVEDINNPLIALDCFIFL